MHYTILYLHYTRCALYQYTQTKGNIVRKPAKSEPTKFEDNICLVHEKSFFQAHSIFSAQ